MNHLLIHNIGLLATPRSEFRDAWTSRIERTAHAAILIHDGRISVYGPESEVMKHVSADTPRWDACGALATPGLVDCHTHPVFVGNRAAEFHLRNAGKTYLEIAAAGGGIQTSARRLREASLEQIVEESLPRLQRSLSCGVTTLEAKSGYGLDWEGEYKSLKAIRALQECCPQRIYPTFLIHVLPADFKDRREEFCEDVVQRMIPAAAEEGLAESVDVFCETGAFTVEESRRFLQAAQARGLSAMIHANQFGNSGGALLAAEVGARSAHHLEYLNDHEITEMSKSGTVGVILPASVFFLGNLPYPPARRMMELGMRIAVSTDMNPGSSMTESLPFCMTAAAIYCKMTPEELLWATTYNAAEVVNAQDETGSIECGKWGDVTLWSVPDLESLSYHFGELRAAATIVGGNVVWRDSHATARY